MNLKLSIMAIKFAKEAAALSQNARTAIEVCDEDNNRLCLIGCKLSYATVCKIGRENER